MPQNAEEAGRQRLSVTVVAHNEAAAIGDCLESAGWADEVIVLDCGSSDGTQDICRERGARVLERAWQGYSAQKNLALAEARHPWVLSLDADERVGEGLRSQILRVLEAGGPADGYRIPRRNIFFGKWLRHGEQWPDFQIRLFRRSRGRFNDRAVHESVEVDGRVEELSEPLEHLSYRTMGEFFERQVRYASLAAGEMARRDVRTRAADFFFRPLWRFFKSYLLKSGWLDGREGLVTAVGSSFYVFMRSAFLWEIRRGRERS